MTPGKTVLVSVIGGVLPGIHHVDGARGAGEAPAAGFDLLGGERAERVYREVQDHAAVVVEHRGAERRHGVRLTVGCFVRE
jgi:hypothetical protein